ncbi:MAG: hypothetical protein KJ709_09425 [Nanoarchaeota archaeon]|nr:hypothetical protein [Nanoarchaeota archaeon]
MGDNDLEGRLRKVMSHFKRSDPDAAMLAAEALDHYLVGGKKMRAIVLGKMLNGLPEELGIDYYIFGWAAEYVLRANNKLPLIRAKNTLGLDLRKGDVDLSQGHDNYFLAKELWVPINAHYALDKEDPKNRCFLHGLTEVGNIITCGYESRDNDPELMMSAGYDCYDHWQNFDFEPEGRDVKAAKALALHRETARQNLAKAQMMIQELSESEKQKHHELVEFIRSIREMDYEGVAKEARQIIRDGERTKKVNFGVDYRVLMKLDRLFEHAEATNDYTVMLKAIEKPGDLINFMRKQVQAPAVVRNSLEMMMDPRVETVPDANKLIVYWYAMSQMTGNVTQTVGSVMDDLQLLAKNEKLDNPEFERYINVRGALAGETVPYVLMWSALRVRPGLAKDRQANAREVLKDAGNDVAKVVDQLYWNWKAGQFSSGYSGETDKAARQLVKSVIAGKWSLGRERFDAEERLQNGKKVDSMADFKSHVEDMLNHYGSLEKFTADDLKARDTLVQYRDHPLFISAAGLKKAMEHLHHLESGSQDLIAKIHSMSRAAKGRITLPEEEATKYKDQIEACEGKKLVHCTGYSVDEWEISLNALRREDKGLSYFQSGLVESYGMALITCVSQVNTDDMPSGLRFENFLSMASVGVADSKHTLTPTGYRKIVDALSRGDEYLVERRLFHAAIDAPDAVKRAESRYDEIAPMIFELNSYDIVFEMLDSEMRRPVRLVAVNTSISGDKTKYADNMALKEIGFKLQKQGKDYVAYFDFTPQQRSMEVLSGVYEMNKDRKEKIQLVMK